nr:hypothetical protein [Tanacetum cinerariifolium]
MTKRHSKEAVMTRTVKLIENDLDAASRIILFKNVQNHRKTKTKELCRRSWSDNGEEDDEKVKNKTCLVAQTSSEVCSESSYFSDENSSIDDLVLDNEYAKLCKMSLKIITKNKRLKATGNSLEKELSILKEKLSTLGKNKRVDLECLKDHMLNIKKEKIKEESLKLTKFEKSTHCLNEMLSNQKPSGDKLGLGFNSFEAPSSGTKEIKFMKAQKKASFDEGPINMGDPLSMEAAPKAIMRSPPAVTPESEKNHGKKRPRESNASSSSITLNHPSSFRPLDDTIDENDEESFHSNSSSHSQNVSSLSNVIPRVRQTLLMKVIT